jgi:hypothetical protein
MRLDTHNHAHTQDLASDEVPFTPPKFVFAEAVIQPFWRRALTSDSYLWRGIAQFASIWGSNKVAILHLTVVNIMTTFVMEALIRTILAKLFQNGAGYEFLVHGGDGYHLNRQSLTNLWITGLTSIFGGPVFFIAGRRHRYLFFVVFGLCVSFLSQGFAFLSLGLPLAGALRGAFLSRLAFDFFYTASFKFALFELARTPLLASPPRVSLRVGAIRLTQDFTTTLIRVSLLNLIGLKG